MIKIEEVGKILPVLRSLTCFAIGTRRLGSVHSVLIKILLGCYRSMKEAGAEGFYLCQLRKWCCKNLKYNLF
jgi:ATP phosphoribosyltransferase